MNYARIPGPGDTATWGPCTGRPADPRTEDEEDPLEQRKHNEQDRFDMWIESRDGRND
jgi:hypothetical protein